MVKKLIAIRLLSHTQGEWYRSCVKGAGYVLTAHLYLITWRNQFKWFHLVGGAYGTWWKLMTTFKSNQIWDVLITYTINTVDTNKDILLFNLSFFQITIKVPLPDLITNNNIWNKIWDQWIPYLNQVLMSAETTKTKEKVSSVTQFLSL